MTEQKPTEEEKRARLKELRLKGSHNTTPEESAEAQALYEELEPENFAADVQAREDAKPSRSSKTKAPTTPEETKRYAVYDLTYERFVGPVVEKKPTKAEAAKLVKDGHDIEIREV